MTSSRGGTMTAEQERRNILFRLATIANIEAKRTGSTLDALAALEADKELAMADAAVYAAYRRSITSSTVINN